MKRHPHMTVEEIFREMTNPEQRPQAIGRYTPEEESIETQLKVREMIEKDPDNIRIICIACEGSAPLLASACCECGGFVCPECIRLEEDGVCDHTAPTLDEE